MILDFQHIFNRSLSAEKKTAFVFESAVVETSLSAKASAIRRVSRHQKVLTFEFKGSYSLSLKDIVAALSAKAEEVLGKDMAKTLERIKGGDSKILVLVKMLKGAVIVIHQAPLVRPLMLKTLQKLCLVVDAYSDVDFRLMFIGDESLLEHGESSGIRFDYVQCYFDGYSNRRIQKISHEIELDIKLERRSVERFYFEYSELLKKTPKLALFLKS